VALLGVEYDRTHRERRIFAGRNQYFQNIGVVEIDPDAVCLYTAAAKRQKYGDSQTSPEILSTLR
jgi:hypothetical protein